MTKDPRLATRDDIDQFAETFGTAMYDDPMIRWPLPSEVSVESVIAMTNPIVSMYVEVGSAWMLEGGLAVASWIAPAAAARFDQLEQPTRAAIAPHTGDNGVRYGQFWDWLAAHLPSEPCWFMDLVAVQPSAWGRGLGGRLIEHGLALAGGDDLPAFLETAQQRNVAYYERFGFRVVGEECAPGGGPTIWFMRT
ncbi:MAG: GNAT family N-acetyltransferase [Actinomycetia bacterium]|nr:GNAT family N-acetyltransferase [Actinomycetes bacterium]